MNIRPIVVDGIGCAYSADLEDDDGRKIGEFELTLTSIITMPDGSTRAGRRFWTVKDANGKELGQGEL